MIKLVLWYAFLSTISSAIINSDERSAPRNLKIDIADRKKWGNHNFTPKSYHYLLNLYKAGFADKASMPTSSNGQSAIQRYIDFMDMNNQELEVNLVFTADKDPNLCCLTQVVFTYAKDAAMTKLKLNALEIWTKHIYVQGFSLNTEPLKMRVKTLTLHTGKKAGDCPNTLPIWTKDAIGDYATFPLTKDYAVQTASYATKATNACIDALSDGTEGTPKPIVDPPQPKPEDEKPLPNCPTSNKAIYYLIDIFFDVLRNKRILQFNFQFSNIIKVTVEEKKPKEGQVTIVVIVSVNMFSDFSKTKDCTFTFVKESENNRLISIKVDGENDPCKMALQWPWTDPNWPITPIEFEMKNDVYLIQIILDLLISNIVINDIDLDYDANAQSFLVVLATKIDITYKFMITPDGNYWCIFTVVREYGNQILKDVKIEDYPAGGKNCANLFHKDKKPFPFNYPSIPGTPESVLTKCEDYYVLEPNRDDFIKTQFAILVATKWINPAVFTQNKGLVKTLTCMTKMSKKLVEYQISFKLKTTTDIDCILIMKKDVDNKKVYMVYISPKSKAECKGALVDPNKGPETTPAPTPTPIPCPVPEPGDVPIPVIPEKKEPVLIGCEGANDVGWFSDPVDATYGDDKPFTSNIPAKSGTEACGKTFKEVRDKIFKGLCVYLFKKPVIASSDPYQIKNKYLKGCFKTKSSAGVEQFYVSFLNSDYKLKKALTTGEARCVHYFDATGKPVKPNPFEVEAATGCGGIHVPPRDTMFE